MSAEPVWTVDEIASLENPPFALRKYMRPLVGCLIVNLECLENSLQGYKNMKDVLLNDPDCKLDPSDEHKCIDNLNTVIDMIETRIGTATELLKCLKQDLHANE